MKYLLTVVVLGCSIMLCHSQEYAVGNIPSALLKDAHVVKRKESIRYEITESNKAKYYQKVAYTILDESGDRWASFFEYYNKLRSIETFEGSLFDASGKKIRSLKKSDIRDVSGNDGASFVDDSRLKWHSFFYKLYPFTVEYEVEINLKGTLYSPAWIPQESEIMSVQSAEQVVVAPADNPLRFRMFNYKGQPVINEEKGNKRYIWQVQKVSAITGEYASPAWREITTSVFMATEKFMLADYSGSYVSWKDFGQFIYGLNDKKDVLPPAVRQRVHELTDGVTDVKEKVKRLYDYMQQNTHYVGIQLGIGGWQPFDATYVANNKYGDCKALSNFMRALLKEAGIRSLYTLITNNSDDNYLLTDLPSAQFNHAILMVPNASDTTWLECTSQTTPAGYVGGGNGNRYALVVDESGGTLVRTPRYGVKENLQARHINATLDGEGNLQARVMTSYSAERQDRLHSVINNMSKQKLMDFLKADLDLATYDIRDFKYNEIKSEIPVIDETLDLIADNYATVTGKRIFIMPNIFTRSNRLLQVEENRRYDIVLNFEFNDIDSTEIKLPAGFVPESMPTDVKVESKFGKYTASVKLVGNSLFYCRNFEHYSGRFAPDQYASLVKFYETIYKADRNKVVLIRKETP